VTGDIRAAPPDKVVSPLTVAAALTVTAALAMIAEEKVVDA